MPEEKNKQKKTAPKPKEKPKPEVEDKLRFLQDFDPEVYDEDSPEDKEKITRDTRKTKENNYAGRPTVMTKQVIAKLEWAFRIDCNEEEACIYAGIDPSTLWRYKQKNPDFASQITEWKQSIPIAARAVIAERVVTLKSADDSWAYLRAKRKAEFAEQKNLKVDTGVVSIEDLERAATDGVIAEGEEE